MSRIVYPRLDALAIDLVSTEFADAAVPAGRARRTSYPSVAAELRFLGPEGDFVHLTGADVRLQGQRESPATDGRGPSVFGPQPLGTFRLAETAERISGSKILGRHDPWVATEQVFLTRGSVESVRAELAQATGFEVTASMDVYRLSVASRLPLELGTELRTPLRHTRVVEVDRSRGRIRVVTRTSSVEAALEYNDDPLPLVPLLHNPSEQQLLRHISSNQLWGTQTTLVGGGTVSITDWEWVFGNLPQSRRGDDTLLPEEWFGGVELLFLDYDYVGSATQTQRFRVDRWPEYGERIPFGGAAAS